MEFSFSQGRWRDGLFEGPFQSSFQACLYVPLQGWARLLPTARFDEHRLSRNTIDLVCALGEQRKLPSPPIHCFCGAKKRLGHTAYPPLEQEATIRILSPMPGQNVFNTL